MTVYTYSEARQNFASLLNKAHVEGEVLIRRKDGQVFSMRPEKSKKSPLSAKGIKAVYFHQRTGGYHPRTA